MNVAVVAISNIVSVVITLRQIISLMKSNILALKPNSLRILSVSRSHVKQEIVLKESHKGRRSKEII